ncbi:MAG: hemerythrin domain-containing protein [Magnetovibrionaceae bacterium]
MTGIQMSDGQLLLGRGDMDSTHREFITLVNKACEADGAAFAEAFAALLAHTEAHFEAEGRLMEQSGFPPIECHKGEHERVLGDFNLLSEAIAEGRWQEAKTYVQEQVPIWFEMHLATMDRALAFHLGAMETA